MNATKDGSCETCQWAMAPHIDTGDRICTKMHGRYGHALVPLTVNGEPFGCRAWTLNPMLPPAADMPQALTWQPIATAPVDRSFLVWPITMKYPAVVRLEMAQAVRATHWLDLDALPKPPTGETQAHAGETEPSK